MSDQRRQPAGVPTGGEFASNEHDEAAPIALDPVDAYDQAEDLIFEATEQQKQMRRPDANLGARMSFAKSRDELIERAAKIMGAEQRYADQARWMVDEGCHDTEIVAVLTKDYARGYEAAERVIAKGATVPIIARQVTEAMGSVDEDSPMSDFLYGGVRAQAAHLVGEFNRGYSSEKKVRAVIEAARGGTAEHVIETARWG